MPTFFAGQTDYIEKLNDVDAAAGAAQDDIDAHIADTTAAHAASAISNTPAGNIAATTVQGAINELDTEKLSASAATLPSSFVNASLTSVGTLTALTVSGQSNFAAGTAAAPSVKVGAEQNGLYSSAADTLDVTLGGVRQFQFARTASAVNYPVATGSATGNPVTISTGGSDTNVYFNYYTKGNGAHQFLTGGGLQLLVGHVASAVNYLRVFGSATGGSLGFFAEGADTNISNYYGTKGSGFHNFATGTGQSQLYVTHTANAVNFAAITGGATGNAVTAAAAGSDSNIDFAITPKGTGNVRFGTHSAIAAETVTGYITIKDSAGNTRKLAVVS